ncbi:hypothetical protein [Tenacibaculum piscium]|uniref:hypothetical protein n=1 Tax=Tenacibaculum piscium TaxID=1458515 RepID=UPI001F1A5B32|nr:hypothetical protein [Tenacibaculum piscium]
MKNFKFNKIQVIESLPNNEKSGTDLFNDIISRKKDFFYPKLKTELSNPSTKKEFIECLNKIKNNLIENGICPIIHFEIHGSNDKKGLILSSGEFLSWKELVIYISEINLLTRNNLFITFAVCYGANFLKEIKINEPSPYWGFIGSFKELTFEDLTIRYEEFYNEFLISLDLTKSISRLHNSNPSIPSSYEFINSEMTFNTIYEKYYNEQFSNEKIKERALETAIETGIIFNTKNEEQDYIERFKKELLKTKDKYRKEDEKIFLMK